MPSFTKDSFTLHYEECGSGEPVLLIMGITADHSVWEPHSSVWQNQFRCLLPDNRGVGQTDAPSGDYSTAQMADDMLALLNHLEIDSVHVVGCSMGSTIAQQVALRAPERVKSLVLMCPWARCDAYARETFEHLLACYRDLSPGAFMQYIQLLIFDKSTWDNGGEHAGFLQGRQSAEDAAANNERQSIQGLTGQTAACINHNVLADLPCLTCPTLIIGGENDIFTPQWMADEIHAALPNSELYLYQDAGHGFHFENIDDFNQRIAAFLTSHSCS